MELSSNSKVWVYQSDRKFTVSEKETINILCQDFIAKWAAHGTSLKSSFKVIDDYFIVLSVDENIASASGCSIDSSVKFIKELGLKFGIDFFNRMNLIVKNDSEVKLISFSDLLEYQDWEVYNPLVNTLGQLNNEFLVPVNKSDFYQMLA